MRNVTITLPEELARRARIEAAKQDKSLSRFLTPATQQVAAAPAVAAEPVAKA